MVTVRLVLNQELPAILGLSGETAWGQVGTEEQTLSTPQQAARGAAAMVLSALSAGGVVLVAEAGDVPLGYVVTVVLPSSITGILEGQILDVFVAPRYRGTGLGQLLLRAAGDWAQRAGAQRAVLMVSNHNQASVKNALRAGFLPERTQFGRLLQPTPGYPAPSPLGFAGDGGVGVKSPNGRVP